ncbi:hypothetical protein DAKH74_042560 [Maudiozyma humilis]|uniref:non-specific serine/threonine protein kinase n=1 Tax=Maudiozyma humilis TaxID=51915 RepID=A0AAV5S1A4_MAUHU|nr:hypothetical protein DAKH74_042560 [Kazachstania humilis]
MQNATINQYKVLGVIGTGAYGVVLHAADTHTHKQYAIKAILKSRQASRNADGEKYSAALQTYLEKFLGNKEQNSPLQLPQLDLDALRSLTPDDMRQVPYYKEVCLQLRVQRHANVVSIHEALDSPHVTFIVMDYYRRDLFTSIVDDQHFAADGQLIKRVFLQICSALQYCHDQGVAHCDIKPENLLLDEHDNVYLCDFGLSSTDRWLKPNVSVGSPYYMAPERLCVDANLAGEFPTASSDIWSLGIILINLACMRNPWLKAHKRDDITFQHFHRNTRVLRKLLPISDEFYGLLCKVLRINPLERISLHALMADVAQLQSFTRDGPLHCVPVIHYEEINDEAYYATPQVGSGSSGATTIFRSASIQTLFDVGYDRSENIQSTCTSDNDDGLCKEFYPPYGIPQNQRDSINV